jgi:hypothetical protein
VLELAHGLVGRSDLPIPEWLFVYAAAAVLVVSFIGLAVLWPEPKLETRDWRPLPGGLGRVLASPPVEIVCGAIGLFLLGVVVWSGLSGVQTAAANFAPTFVYVVFWVGLVPVSVLFGDVFRAFNPWRAAGKAVAWVAQRAAGGSLPAPLAYPERLGHWPAAVGIFLFATIELVVSNGDLPENVAIATLIYSAITWVAMALFGVEAWIERGEAFSVYFNLFSRLSPFERRGGEVGLRRPLSGLAWLRFQPGTVPLLAVMIGSVSFDGFAESEPWTQVTPDIARFFEDLGLTPERALESTFLLGLLGGVLVIYGLYRLAMLGARSVGGGFDASVLAGRFVHSLVPIALAYVMAHYWTLLLYQGQAIWSLASNPLGEAGTDLFGTADRPIDYGVIGATAAWYWQVGFVVTGHVTGLTLAHDRALVMYDRAKLAIRSQYWVLVAMVLFTCLALWLLSQANN